MAFFPLSDALAETITGQQRRVLDRFPGGCPWLFPAPQANLDGRKPNSDRRFRDQLAVWLERIHLVEEHGRPARVTCHQFGTPSARG